MTLERDYVLGTHDDEIARLGVQHRVWQARVRDVWRRAGLGPGHTLIDVGCGPGYASIDLAAVAGPTGRVLAVDRSRRFLDALEAAREARGLRNIETFECDLDEDALPPGPVDGAWCRWVLAFVKHPRRLLEQIHARLRTGGVFVSHEYLDYATWRFLPASAEFEEFVRFVMASWRAAGGEPDIARPLPAWLSELGFDVEVRPIVDVIGPSHAIWPWPRAFVESGLRRLVELGVLGADRADATWRLFVEREKDPRSLMVMPLVLEVIATRR